MTNGEWDAVNKALATIQKINKTLKEDPWVDYIRSFAHDGEYGFELINKDHIAINIKGRWFGIHYDEDHFSVCVRGGSPMTGCRNLISIHQLVKKLTEMIKDDQALQAEIKMIQEEPA